MALEELLAALTGAQSENAVALSGIASGKKDIAEDNIALLQGQSGNMQAVSGQKMAGDLAAQENAIAVRQALGNDPNDPNSMLAILVQDFRENTMAAREQQIAIAQKQQVGLFDDPLQYLVNSVTLPDEINAMNANAGRAQVAAQGISTMQNLTTAAAQAQQATKQNLTKQSIQAQSEMESATLQAKVNALKMDSLGYDAEAVKASQHANADRLQLEMQKLDIVYRGNAEVRAASSETRQSGQYNWLMADRKAAKEGADIDASIISVGAKSMGLPGFTADEIERVTKYGTPSEKAKLSAYREQGNKVASTGITTVGDTPGEAFTMTELTGGLRGKEYAETRTYLEGVAKRAYAAAGNPKLDAAGWKKIGESMDDLLLGPPDKKGKRQYAKSEFAKASLDAEAPGYIYKAPELSVLAQVPAVQNSFLYKDVIAPAVAAGVRAADPETILRLSIEAQARLGFSDNQLATGIADIYKANNANVWVSKGLSKMNLPYSNTYVAKVPSAFGWASDMKDQINFADPAEVLSYKTALEARNRLSSIGIPGE